MPSAKPRVYRGFHRLHPRGRDYLGLRIEFPTPNRVVQTQAIGASCRVVPSLQLRPFIMRYGNQQPEAPTHLGSHQLPLPPEWLPAEDFEDDDDGPTRAARGRGAAWTPIPAQDISISGPTRMPTERSASPLLLEQRIERPHPDDVRREPHRSSRTIEGHRGSKSRSGAAPVAVAGARSIAVPTDARGSSRSVAAPSTDEGQRSSKPRSGAAPVAGTHGSSDGRGSSRSAAPHPTDEERRSFVASGEVDTSARRPSAPDADEAASVWSRQAPAPKKSSKSKSKKLEVEEKSASASASASASESARGSEPVIDPVKLQQQQAAALAAMGAIDPMVVPVPPELGGPIYGWIRRLALQADLNGADKVLREAFLDLTSSLSIAVIYPGADGLWTLGQDAEIPKEATPIVAVAQARRAMISSHTALIPVVTSTETVAVIVLTRNPRNPGYHPIEQVAMVALARESAAILHHLAVAHLQKTSEIKADQGGLYRGEALEAHRTRGNEGVPVNLSPSWVKRAYPTLVVGILIAILFAIFVRIPTYSTGTGAVIVPGVAITAPTGGSVDEVLVKPQQYVNAGTVVVKLHAQQEDAEIASVRKDYDNLTTSYLFDPNDEQTKKSLTAIIPKVEREEARLESRTIRAKVAGTVSDIRVRPGTALQPGEQILQIVNPSTDLEVSVFLPGKDRPRLRVGQDLQVEIIGYTKSRDIAKITYVSPEVMGQADAAKAIGAQVADAIKLAPGSYVWVRARLPSKTFKTQHNTWFYHHGMPVKAEVKTQSKPFLVTLLPSLEKYLPD